MAGVLRKGRHGAGEEATRGPSQETGRGLVLGIPRPEGGVRPGGQAEKLWPEKYRPRRRDGSPAGPQLWVPGN